MPRETQKLGPSHGDSARAHAENWAHLPPKPVVLPLSHFKVTHPVGLIIEMFLSFLFSTLLFSPHISSSSFQELVTTERKEQRIKFMTSQQIWNSEHHQLCLLFKLSGFRVESHTVTLKEYGTTRSSSEAWSWSPGGMKTVWVAKSDLEHPCGRERTEVDVST